MDQKARCIRLLSKERDDRIRVGQFVCGEPGVALSSTNNRFNGSA